MPFPILYERLIAGHYHPVAMHFYSNNAVALREGITHHIGDLIHLHLEGIDIVDPHPGPLTEPVGQKVHIQHLMGIGTIGEPVFRQHLDRVPIQLFLFPGRGGNDIKVFLANPPLIQ